ncbi:MAG: hypothetical protein KAR19_12100 [Bacteroidales bacterium]|nr:hypothetical protein [Bacteroidales bacterium]
MTKDNKKQNPFSVPEGYFESFPGKLQERIREMEETRVPVRKIGRSSGFRLALAAAILGVALISYSIIRITIVNYGRLPDYTDIALLEEMGIIDDDSYLVGFLETGAEILDEEEAYMSQAMEYLALNNVEMDLIFE